MSANTFNLTRKLIETEFISGWNSRTPLKLPNAPLNRPAAADWAALHILFGDSKQASLGASGERIERAAGVIELQIFGAVNKGAGTLIGHADFAAAIFRMKNLTEGDFVVRIRTPRISQIVVATAAAVTQGEDWFQVNVSWPFETDGFF